MAATPTFTSTPRDEVVQIATANTARDGTGTAPLLISSVAAGTLVFRITATATGTTTAGVLRLFRSSDGGTTKRMIEELLVGAITPSTTAATWRGAFTLASWTTPIVLGASTNDQLYVSTNNAETFNIVAEAGDLT